jgi:quercetin dioxygenase-like cupin family protein
MPFELIDACSRPIEVDMPMIRTFRTSRVLLPAALIGVLAFAIAFASPTPSASPAAASTVVASREVLVEGSPVAAPGQVLQLVRYTIPQGVVLPMHVHPGMQIAWIESGVLHYTVVEGGEIPIQRAWMEGSPEPLEMLGPGESTDLYPGDSVVEVLGVVHYGENLGKEPVVILAATLLEAGQPPAIVVTPAASPTP